MENFSTLAGRGHCCKRLQTRTCKTTLDLQTGSQSRAALHCRRETSHQRRARHTVTAIVSVAAHASRWRQQHCMAARPGR